jgi:hypothetical protein
VLEFGHEYIIFYYNGQQLKYSGDIPLSVPTPYDNADVSECQVLQINDVVYIFHPLYPPQKLIRVSHTYWTFDPLVEDYPALLDPNITNTTITPSGLTGTITLTASDPIFAANSIGSKYKLEDYRSAQNVSVDITGNATSAYLTVAESCIFRTSGTWIGDVLIEKSIDNGVSWHVIRAYSGKEDLNVETDITVDEISLIRFKIANWVLESPASSATPRATLECSDSFLGGLVEVTGYTSDTVVTAEVIEPLYSTSATKFWAESAWSARRGYPTCATFHEQRIIVGGTVHQPQTLWFSNIGDFQNFKYGTKDSDGFSYTIASQERNEIKWIQAHSALAVGTSGSEWIISSGNSNGPLSPTNTQAKKQSNYGSGTVPALVVNDTIMFTQQMGRTLREMDFSFEKDKFISPDITTFSEHISGGGIIQMAYQRQPFGILWAVTLNGDLIGLTHQKEQSVMGWHRHTTEGRFQSVCVISTPSGDEVWCVVLRNIEGEWKRYIERLNPIQWEAKEDMFYVDCGVSPGGPIRTEITGLDHLEGKTVSILADGCVEPNQVVAGGKVTIQNPSNIIHVGLPYVSELEPMRLDVDPYSGTSMGQVKQIREVVVRVHKSLGMTVGNGVAEREVPFRSTDDLMDDSPPLFTGDKVVDFDGDFDSETRMIIKQTEPLPLTILAFVVKYQITGI